MGAYRRVYPRHTSKEVIFQLLRFFKVCKLILSLFALLDLGWSTEVVHSKQLARIARMTSVSFLC